jgi:hypothetical protein
MRTGKRLGTIVLSLLAFSGANLAAAERVAAPPEIEKALRARVETFYGYFKEGKFRQAETMVEEESRDAYYNTPKTRIIDFEIKNMSFEPDLQRAMALVTCKMITAGIESAAPLNVPMSSRWKQVDGEWYLYLPQKSRDASGTRTPFGSMHFDPNASPATAPGGAGGGKPATLEGLSGLYQVDTNTLRFKTEGSGPVTQVVRMSNPGPARLALEHLTRNLPALVVTHQPERVEAGEDMLISFTYDPRAAKMRGRFTYSFRVEPIMQSFTVRVIFE